MANRSRKVYRPKKPVKTFFKVFGSIIAVLILLAVFVFFYFQRYIVIDPDSGLRLEIPFLEYLNEDEAQ